MISASSGSFIELARSSVLLSSSYSRPGSTRDFSPQRPRKRNRKDMRTGLLVLTWITAGAAEPNVPSGWKYLQAVGFEQTGFSKVALPPQIMNAARSDLSDLRVF